MIKNKFTRQYINSIKLLLPLYGSEERTFLNSLDNHINIFFRDRKISSVNELYDEFGYPQEVVHNYLSSIDTEDLVPKITKFRSTKNAAIIMCIAISAISIVVSSFAIYIYVEAITGRVTEYYQELTTYDEHGNPHTVEVGRFKYSEE